MGLQRAETSSAGSFWCLWLRSNNIMQMVTMSSSNWTGDRKIFPFTHASGWSIQTSKHHVSSISEQLDSCCVLYLSKVPGHTGDVVSTSSEDFSFFIHHVFLPLLLIRQIHPVLYGDGELMQTDRQTDGRQVDRLDWLNVFRYIQNLTWAKEQNRYEPTAARATALNICKDTWMFPTVHVSSLHRRSDRLQPWSWYFKTKP